MPMGVLFAEADIQPWRQPRKTCQESAHVGHGRAMPSELWGCPISSRQGPTPFGNEAWSGEALGATGPWICEIKRE